MIPEEKTAAVERALREAFAVSNFEDVASMKKRSSSTLVLRIIVRGRPYLLRIILRKDDHARHFACMRAAAQAGLAPHVWYTNAEDKVAITDFIEPAPFPAAEALAHIPGVLRRLHAIPAFPEIPNHINTSCMFLMNQGTALESFLERFEAASIFSASETRRLFQIHSQLAAAYTRDDADRVSSHNDLKPENMIFNGRRAWLVDWEAAFLNDRYNDLAVFANFVVSNDAEEKTYLTTYFGQPPDGYQLARFFLMRQVAHMFSAMAWSFVGWSQCQSTAHVDAFDFTSFHRRIWASEVDLEDSRMKIVYGRYHLEQLLGNAASARYRDALDRLRN